MYTSSVRPRSVVAMRFWLLVILFLVSTFVAPATSDVLAVSYQLSGKVSDQSGNGLASVTVDVINPTTAATVASTITNISGTYTLSVEQGTYDVRVTPTAASGFGPAVALGRTITRATTLDFVLVPAGVVTLSGKVRDPLGNGLAGQTVELAPGGGAANVWVTTNASGDYALQVAPGNYFLSVSGVLRRACRLPRAQAPHPHRARKLRAQRSG
ncbi:MAG TPA: carboxypeptidase-like regulatory domain-containing protein [Herpetosiphonaceae bacterium]